MNIDIKGLNGMKRKLEDLEKRAKGLDGSHQIPFTELLTSDFMSSNTKFQTFDAMIEAGRYKVESPEDFAAIPENEWDAFVAKATKFPSWQEMQNSAGAEWAKRQLGL